MLGFLRFDPVLILCPRTSAILHGYKATAAHSVVVTHKGHVTSDALEMPLTRVYKSGTIRILVKNHHYTALITGGHLPNSVSYLRFRYKT